MRIITALLFQEEIEYTRALDDQDGSSFWRPSLLQFNNITFYLQVHYTIYTLHTYTRYSFCRPSLLQFNNITFYLQVHYTLYTHALDILSGDRHYYSLIILHSTFRFINHYALYTHTLNILSGDFQFNNITFYLQVHYALYTIHPYTRYSFWRLSV